jgi:hypothetical protein
VEGKTCVLALSSRPWLGYADPITKGFVVTPLNYVDLEWGWNFSSEQCEEGVVGIQGQSLRYVYFSDSLIQHLLHMMRNYFLAHRVMRFTHYFSNCSY